jgi:ligand-binding sensor domain-containing protein
MIIFCSSHFFAQEGANFHFKQIKVEEGLSESTVYCILQDLKGFMWLGTKDGLNRYDGVNFRIFRSSSENTRSIGNNFIRSIAEKDSCTLYIGTDAGIYIMNTTDETFNKINCITPEGEAVLSAVNTIYVDHQQEVVWIGTMSQGIFIYDMEHHTLQKVAILDYDLQQHAVWSIIKDKSGIIWVGTRPGLLRYNADIGKLVIDDNHFSYHGGYDREVLTIFEDDKGNLWLGTWADGIRFFNKQSGEFTSFMGRNSDNFSINHVRVIFRYNEKSLLIGSDDGLYIFDMETYSGRRGMPFSPRLENSAS